VLSSFLNLASRLLARKMKLPAARYRHIKMDCDLKVVMPDGAILLTDRYFPSGITDAPIVLTRTPYGRGRESSLLWRMLAGLGYQVVVQSVRGTFGSGGAFDPLRHEAVDGLATLRWLEQQSWFTGKVGLFGGSYFGYTQWAVAADAPPWIKAMVPLITATDWRPLFYSGESFGLWTAASWMHSLHHQESSWWRFVLSERRQVKTLEQALAHLPLNEIDKVLVGHRVSYYQDWLVHDRPGDGFWSQVNQSRRLVSMTIPTSLLATWYDIFLPAQLADYVTLRKAGHRPQLIIGPGTHDSPQTVELGVRQTVDWFDTHLRDAPSPPNASPVRVYMLGADTWIDFPDWPPPASPEIWFLQSGRELARDLPTTSPPDAYTYNPADPTPTIGGVMLGAAAGPCDNRALEARPDVVSYTSAPLDRDLPVIGLVSVVLYVRSSCEYTDFFTRLCDVAPNGVSTNICDGLLRLSPENITAGRDGIIRVRTDLWPTACLFAKGHRLRLQVSSGSHPRFSRNTGSGEPLATATTLHVAHQQIFHDPEHPAALILPVYRKLTTDMGEVTPTEYP